MANRRQQHYLRGAWSLGYTSAQARAFAVSHAGRFGALSRRQLDRAFQALRAKAQ